MLQTAESLHTFAFCTPSLTISLVTQLSKYGPLLMLRHGLHWHGMPARILFFALYL